MALNSNSYRRSQHSDRQNEINDSSGRNESCSDSLSAGEELPSDELQYSCSCSLSPVEEQNYIMRQVGQLLAVSGANKEL